MTDDHDDAKDDLKATPERLAEIRRWYDRGSNLGADWVEEVADLLDHIDWLEAEVARLKQETGG